MASKRLYKKEWDEGLRLFQQGKYGRALRKFELVLQVRPRSPKVLLRVALCHQQLGNALLSQHHLNRARVAGAPVCEVDKHYERLVQTVRVCSGLVASA